MERLFTTAGVVGDTGLADQIWAVELSGANELSGASELVPSGMSVPGLGDEKDE